MGIGLDEDCSFLTLRKLLPSGVDLPLQRSLREMGFAECEFCMGILCTPILMFNSAALRGNYNLLSQQLQNAVRAIDNSFEVAVSPEDCQSVIQEVDVLLTPGHAC